MTQLKFKSPWQEVNTSTILEAQLYKELSKKHILYGKKVTAIAKRQDSDEVLFKIEEFTKKYAFVHLTWSQEPNLNENWPSTSLYSDVREVQIVLDEDARDWIEYENSPLNETGGFIKGKKRIIIVGASSGIGREMAKQLAIDGNLVAVTGRRIHLLEELRTMFGGRIIFECFDVTKTENVPRLESLVTRLGGLDTLIISAGGGDVSKELDWGIDKLTVDTNVNGFIEIANWAFNYFVKQGYGQLTAISSIAAIRGGSHAPAYNASKAFQSNYFEGLAIKARRLKKNIAVTCIEPGFVATKMAKSDKLFWVVPVEKAARQIIRAIEMRKRKVYISRRWWIIAKILKWAPHWIYRRIG